MKSIFTILVFLIVITASAQDSIQKPKVFIPSGAKTACNAIWNVPEFPGGILEMNKFIAANLKYPAEAKKNNVSGRVVVTFTVNEDGSLSNIKVARGLGDGCDEEALRVVKSMPAWMPVMKNGVPLKADHVISIACGG